MVDINLLPWRENLYRHQVKQIQKILLFTLLLSVLSILGPHLFLKQRETTQQARLASLEAQLEQKNFLQSQIKTSPKQSLPVYYQFDMAYFFNLFSKPNTEICFSSISRTERGLSFQGKSNSTLALTQFLLNWKGTSFFPEVKIEQLNKAVQTPLVQFRFHALETQREAK